MPDRCRTPRARCGGNEGQGTRRYRSRAVVVLLGLAALLAGSTPVRGQSARPVALDPERHLVLDEDIADAGEAYQFDVLEHAFGFVNRGDRPLTIRSTIAVDPAGEAVAEPSEVEPGQRGVVRVRQPLGARLGAQRFGFEVASDDPRNPLQRLVLLVFAQSAYDIERPFLDFGLVERSAGKTVEMELGSREVPSIALDAVVSAPDFVEVREAARTGVAAERATLAITIRPGAPRGQRAAVIHLRTNVAHQPDYLVGFQAGIFDDVVPEPAFLQLGAVRRGETFEREVRLVSRSGRPFAVDGVTDGAGRARVTAANCEGGRAPAACWKLGVRIAEPREGTIRGELSIRLAGDAEVLPLPYAGLVASADARIDDLGALGEGATRREVESPEPER